MTVELDAAKLRELLAEVERVRDSLAAELQSERDANRELQRQLAALQAKYDDLRVRVAAVTRSHGGGG